MVFFYFFGQLFDENRFNDHQHIWPLNLKTSSNVTIRTKGLITNRQQNLVLSKFCQCELSLRRYFCKTKFRFCRWEREREAARGLQLVAMFEKYWGSEFSRHPGIWVFRGSEVFGRSLFSRHPGGLNFSVSEVWVFVTPVKKVVWDACGKLKLWDFGRVYMATQH